MARIQILELPAQIVGDLVSTPFALVIDQVETETDEVRSVDGEFVPTNTRSELTQDEAERAARAVGAVGAILAACTLDVA